MRHLAAAPAPAPSPDRPPVIRPLTQHGCLELLARHHVGRLAFAFHDRVDITPIHYVYDGGWLYGRTSAGAKLVTLAHNRWVAFEVDEVRDTFDWASVVVRGTFHRIDDAGALQEARTAAHATALLRRIVPETFAAGDPAPSRTVLFRIALGEVSGREAMRGACDGITCRDGAPCSRDARPVDPAPRERIYKTCPTSLSLPRGPRRQDVQA